VGQSRRETGRTTIGEKLTGSIRRGNSVDASMLMQLIAI
jgi:hypothetical protein